MRVRWYAGDRKPRRPAHSIGDIGRKTAALAQHAYRHNFRHPVHPNNTQVIVPCRTDRAGNVRTVPRTVGHRAAHEWSAL